MKTNFTNMKRLFVLLLSISFSTNAQIVTEFRQWYLDKQITNAALLSNAPASNVMASFSTGRYEINFPGLTSNFSHYQYLVSGTYANTNSPHKFGAYVWGQQESSNELMLNYAYEMPVGRKTTLSTGLNLGVYDPADFKNSKVFRYGLSAALQSKNKENYVGISFPHMVTLIHKGDFIQGDFSALILQGGYTFYLPYDLKFTPAVYLQFDVFKPQGPVKPGQSLSVDLGFHYKGLIYVNGAVGVQNFGFERTQLQRFGAAIRPTPALMIGYQRDALDAATFKYHSIWLRYSLLDKTATSKSKTPTKPIKKAPQRK